MGKSLADAMTAQPGPDSLAYWLAPLKGYWDRQGRMASQGLQMADQGAQAVRGGDMGGLAGMLLGPVGYLSSPINALFPERSEVEAATDVPEWSKPLIAGGLETMAIMAPGPKGARGLGRGMAQLADDATDAERAALAGRMEAEAGQVGGAPSAVSRDQALTNLTQAPEGILAYHGSPHTFDKFDMSKIGTGEGAQAYGHGLYFAENEGVARSYADVLPKNDAWDGRPQFKIDSSTMGPNNVEVTQYKKYNPFGGGGTRQESFRPKGLLDEYQSVDAALADLKAKGLVPEKHVSWTDDLGDLHVSSSPSNMYQVRLNVKPDELLDWDRPLSEQSESVRSILNGQPEVQRKIDAMRRIVGDKAENMSGKSAYAALTNWRQGVDLSPTGEAAVATTQKLKAAGIKGIRYKDAGSRGAEGGTYNYVIFDDKLVDILKRYGVAMTAGAGGAMIVSGQNMPPDVAAQLDLQG